MALTAELVRSINAYLNVKASTTQRVTSFVQSSWNSLDSYRDVDIARFANRVSPVVEGAQIQIGQLTNGYLATLESAITGRKVSPLGLSNDLFSTQALRGITTKEAFNRTGSTIWFGLSEQKSLDMLIGKALNRALDIAKTNLQLASTHSARAVFARNERVVGYRRVLTGGETCKLCQVASTQRYHKQNLMPIHPGCDCGVSPIYGNVDPGQVIDSKTENDSDVKIVTYEHGEIGPVLAVAGQEQTIL